MKQTAYLSATTLNARQRRGVVIAVLLAWLTMLLICPNVMNGVNNPVSAGEQHASHAAMDPAHDTSHDEACCTAVQHATALMTAQKFHLAVYFILTLVLPVIGTLLATPFVAMPHRDYRRSSRLGSTENLLLFRALWPQAPPR